MVIFCLKSRYYAFFTFLCSRFYLLIFLSPYGGRERTYCFLQWKGTHHCLPTTRVSRNNDELMRRSREEHLSSNLACRTMSCKVQHRLMRRSTLEVTLSSREERRSSPCPLDMIKFAELQLYLISPALKPLAFPVSLPCVFFLHFFFLSSNFARFLGEAFFYFSKDEKFADIFCLLCCSNLGWNYWVIASTLSPKPCLVSTCFRTGNGRGFFFVSIPIFLGNYSVCPFGESEYKQNFSIATYYKYQFTLVFFVFLARHFYFSSSSHFKCFVDIIYR